MPASDKIPGRELVHSSPTPKTRSRVVTVRDLRTRICWLCSRGDQDDQVKAKAYQYSGSADSKMGNKECASLLRFVHPCTGCHLIAHQGCLLKWIYGKSMTTDISNVVVRCPQCGDPYRLNSPTPWQLRYLESIDRALHRIHGAATVGFFVGSYGLAFAKYGECIARVWLGDAASRPLLHSERKDLKMELFTIPLVLLLSRVPYLPDWTEVPRQVLLCAAPFLLDRAHGLWSLSPYNQSLTNKSLLQGVWPPSLAWSLALMPLYRQVYSEVKYQVTDRLLEPLVRQAQAFRDPPKTEQGQHGQPSRPYSRGLFLRPSSKRDRPDMLRIYVLGIGGRESDFLLDSDGQAQPPLLGTEGAGEEYNDAAVRAAARQGRTLPRATVRVMFVSPRSTNRLIWTALGTPLMAVLLGAGLQVVAMCMWPGNWLERLLGISAFRRNRATTAGGWSTARHHGVPSLHWRNTVALGLYVVACDAASLGYRYLRLKRRTQTTVEDLPFSESVAKRLHLKDVE